MNGFQKFIAVVALCLHVTHAVFNRFKRKSKRNQKDGNDNPTILFTNPMVSHVPLDTDTEPIDDDVMIGFRALRVVLGLNSSFKPMDDIVTKTSGDAEKDRLRKLDKDTLARIATFLFNENKLDAGSTVVFSPCGQNKDSFEYKAAIKDETDTEIIFGDTGKVLHVDYSKNPTVYTVKLNVQRWIPTYSHDLDDHFPIVNVQKKDLNNGFEMLDLNGMPRDIYGNEIKDFESFDTFNLHNAIKDRDVQLVKGLIRIGANVNHKTFEKTFEKRFYNKCPAHLAIMCEPKGQADTIGDLLKAAGASINA